MFDSQFSLYSTQCGMENITLTNEVEEKFDCKGVSWTLDDDKMLASP